MENYIKYPRTLHLPSSPSVNSDDKQLKDLTQFIGEEVVVTIKMDGENTTMYQDHIHARSIDSNNHPSRDWVKRFHSTMKHDIPKGWRVCGENLYAKHSIEYHKLEHYFQVFSIWDEHNECLSWDDTEQWCDMLGLTPVNVIYRGEFNEWLIDKIFQENQDYALEEGFDAMEGYVVRLASSFHYDDFSGSLAKWVRPNHVQTNKHWTQQEIIPNRMVG